MKQLLILRHAEAMGTETGGTDKTRKLSPRGFADAQALGKLMARQDLNPDLVLCSAATRTRQTLDGVLESVEAGAIEYVEALYNAPLETLLSAIQYVEGAERVLIVAHNPGVHGLAARLGHDDGSTLVDRLSMSYPPATLSVLDCDIAEWRDLKMFENNVSAIHETTEYNAEDRPTRWM